MHPEALAIVGPVGVRRFEALHICEAFEGHEHNYAHATIVISGRIRVSREVVRDGQVVDAGTTEHGPGDVIAIPAKMRHTIKALAPHTRYLCVFSHRDLHGLVTEAYEGHLAAYQ